MLTLEEKEELIDLINNRGMDPELLALELNIPEEEIKGYIKEAKVLKDKENQISTNIKTTKKSKKKSKKVKKEILPDEQEVEEMPIEQIKGYIPEDYEEVIKKTQEIIEDNQKRNKLVDMNKRNFLAYTYFSAGYTEEAKQELEKLISEYQSILAYQQMIYIERKQGNLDDARFWAYEGIDNHPQNANVMKQLISILEKTGELDEAIEIAEKLRQINPQVDEYQKLVKRLQKSKINEQDLEK